MTSNFGSFFTNSSNIIMRQMDVLEMREIKLPTFVVPFIHTNHSQLLSYQYRLFLPYCPISTVYFSVTVLTFLMYSCRLYSIRGVIATSPQDETWPVSKQEMMVSRVHCLGNYLIHHSNFTSRGDISILPLLGQLNSSIFGGNWTLGGTAKGNYPSSLPY